MKCRSQNYRLAKSAKLVDKKATQMTKLFRYIMIK